MNMYPTVQITIDQTTQKFPVVRFINTHPHPIVCLTPPLSFLAFLSMLFRLLSQKQVSTSILLSRLADLSERFRPRQMLLQLVWTLENPPEYLYSVQITGLTSYLQGLQYLSLQDNNQYFFFFLFYLFIYYFLLHFCNYFLFILILFLFSSFFWGGVSYSRVLNLGFRLKFLLTLRLHVYILKFIKLPRFTPSPVLSNLQIYQPTSLIPINVYINIIFNRMEEMKFA